jgi:type I restriction enzyme, S subunit
MELKAGYKQTEVGVIPEDWGVKQMGQIGTLTMGKGLLKEDLQLSGHIPAIPYTALYTDFNEVIDYAEIKWFVDETSAPYVVNEPCVLIASSSNMEANTGKAAALPDSKRVAVGREVITFKSSSDSRYVSYLLSTASYRRKTLSIARGTTIKHLYPATFVNYALALPPKPEQYAIAEALSDADALIESLDQLITKKRDLKQAAMQQLLTGQTRLPGFCGEWEVKRLGSTATLKARIGWQGLTTAEYLESGTYHLVTGTEFNDGRIDWDHCHYVEESRYRQDRYIQLQANDVLVTKDGTIGKVALVRDMQLPATLNSGVFVIRPLAGAFQPEFFYYLLCSKLFTEFLEQLSAGSTINHLYQKDFVGFVYRAPATAGEQTAIASILSDMDTELAELESRLAKARQIKQGMMQELLTGRIRLL